MKVKSVKKAAPKKTASPKAADWRAELLARLRALIVEADPEMVEEAKWRKPLNPAGVSLWSHDGMICTGEKYKDKVKLTFAYGASLPDPSRLFNSSLDAGTRRAIDFPEGAKINEKAFIALIRAAVKLNTSRKRRRRARRRRNNRSSPRTRGPSARPSHPEIVA